MEIEDLPSSRRMPLQTFIFERELAEIYLLIDYVSGRTEKRLLSVDGTEEKSRTLIGAVCDIGWPPGSEPEATAAQAAQLMEVRDKLNTAAKPATGASIAFTLLVTGDDAGDPNHKKKTYLGCILKPVKKFFRWLCKEERTSADDRVIDPKTSGDSDGAAYPTRLSLAQKAYPGLMRSASAFSLKMNALIWLLGVWLLFTCILSWDVSVGRAILTRLDAVELSRGNIVKAINEQELKSAPEAKPSAFVPLCERRHLVWPSDFTGHIVQFDAASTSQLCGALAETERTHLIERRDLADWLAPWRWMKVLSTRFCQEPCDRFIGLKETEYDSQQWAAVLLEVLVTSVLPLCYGFLGAGAAVVRLLYTKMKDSLLSPRDMAMAFGQLALGAVVGACIGLFISPSGQGGTGGLIGSVTLTPSAISFVAGFGVEGVFVALEGLVARVFSLPERKP